MAAEKKREKHVVEATGDVWMRASGRKTRKRPGLRLLDRVWILKPRLFPWGALSAFWANSAIRGVYTAWSERGG